MTENTQQAGGVPRRNRAAFAAAGLAIGAAAGAVAYSRRRPDQQTPRDPLSQEVLVQPSRLVDWEQARSIAINMNRGEAMTSVERARLDERFQALTDQAIPVVSDYLEVSLPENAGRSFAFDRIDWINANLTAFQHMLAPFESLMAGESSRNTAAELWSSLNRKAVTWEVGILLGYLARRVLGQYDLALLGREPVESGNLFYVEPNIAAVERSLRLPAYEFRMWLALHETTHVFQFEAFAWVRPHFNHMLEQYFEYLKDDVRQISQSARNLKIIVDRIRSAESSNESWIQAIMTQDQRVLFDQLQAMMSLVEGYSNHIMNAVGRDMLPNFEYISRQFELRKQNRSQAEKLFARVTGLEMKMEQYRQGQAFVDHVVNRRGKNAARRVWENPDSVPTMDEIRDPDKWIVRVLD